MKKEMTYMDKVHKWGTAWNLSMVAVLLAFPIVVALIFKAAPDWNGLLVGLLATAPMYWAVGVVETITYIPMLGAGGAYLSFVTGNISNLKLPCALNALEQAEVKASSEEGEVVSTIAIAISSIVTIFIIILGVLLAADNCHHDHDNEHNVQCQGNEEQDGPHIVHGDVAVISGGLNLNDFGLTDHHNHFVMYAFKD